MFFYRNVLNASNCLYKHQVSGVKSTEVALKVGVLVPVCVMGIFLNFVVLLALFKHRCLRSSNNYLIANLAFSDLLSLLVGPWFMLIHNLGRKPFLKDFGCKFDGFIQGFSLLSGVCAVVLLTYDRLALVALNRESRIKKKFVPRIIALCWFLSLVLAIPFLIFKTYEEKQWLDYLQTHCNMHYEILGIYWYFIIIIIVWVPLTLLVLTYGTILWSLNKSKKYIRTRGKTGYMAKARVRAMYITTCVLIAAIICKVPTTGLIYMKNQLYRHDGSYDHEHFRHVWFVVNFLMYLDCAINPLIYAFSNARFRRAMDSTPGIACCKFGSWCCVCTMITEKPVAVDKNRNVFIIEDSPKVSKEDKIDNPQNDSESDGVKRTYTKHL